MRIRQLEIGSSAIKVKLIGVRCGVYVYTGWAQQQIWKRNMYVYGVFHFSYYGRRSDVEQNDPQRSSLRLIPILTNPRSL